MSNGSGKRVWKCCAKGHFEKAWGYAFRAVFGCQRENCLAATPLEVSLYWDSGPAWCDIYITFRMWGGRITWISKWRAGVSNCLFAWTIGHQEMIDDFCEPIMLQTVVTQENARNDTWSPLNYSTRDYINIARANRCDLELYTIAQEIFYERVAQLL